MKAVEELALSIATEDKMIDAIKLGFDISLSSIDVDISQKEQFYDEVEEVVKEQYQDIFSDIVAIYDSVYSEEEAQALVDMNRKFPSINEKNKQLFTAINNTLNLRINDILAQKAKEIFV